METNILLKDIAFTIVDLETTGFHPSFGDKICEIGILRVKNGEEQNSFQALINPGRPISPGASAVSGITDDMVRAAPAFGEVVHEILSLFEGAVIVGHNAPFDLEFILTQLRSLRLPLIDNPVLDTLTLARKYFNFPSNALGNIARTLNFPVENEHRAMGDVKTTKRLLEYILNFFKRQSKIETLADLLRLQGGSIKYPEPEEIILPPLLEESFKSRKLIKMEYISRYGTKTIREIEPRGVSKYRDYIYLVAFCNLRKKERTFRLDRILKMDLK